MTTRISKLKEVKKVVVKLGSHIVTGEGYATNRDLFDWLADDIIYLKERGVDVMIVSSGAVACGLGRMGQAEPPTSIPEKQALAAVGQLNLMWSYKEAFGAKGLIVGQVLLTRDDLRNRRRYLNAKNTINQLFEKNVVPIINENDTVVVDEIKFGDNDNLSALVCNLIEADCLIILSDVEGLFDKDPKSNKDAKLVEVVEQVDEAVENFVGESKTAVGTGGMGTKLLAAKRAVDAGVDAVIASGSRPNMLRRLLDGEGGGSFFPALEDRMKRRKHWIAYTVKSSGDLILDDGAVRALTEKGKSLLPKGVVRVEGVFERGDAVRLLDKEGKRIGKGLTNYSSEEVNAIVGLASWEIVDRLGYKYYDEVIHRDDMVVDR
jgi:glutamate 5-kinase